MALFEIEDGHLFPAQFGRPVANGLTPDVVEAVRDQVLEIVSRPLFPITWRDMSRVSDPTNDQPRLTALDASGQVVSVEVVEHLDSETLIASLSRLADTAALSWTDLAREYPGDIEGFKAGWMHFRDSMPPSPAPGPRLVMVVGSIDLQVRPALDVLASSGVEVHEMSLRQMSNGRSFLEVHAVGPRLYGHVPQVLLGRTGQIPELASLSDPGAPILSGGAPASAAASAAEAGAAAQAIEAMERPRHARSASWESAEPAGAPDDRLDAAAEAATTAAEMTIAAVPDATEVPDATGVVSAADAGEGAAAVLDAPVVPDAPAAGASAERIAADDDGDVPLLARDAAGLEALGQIVGEDVPLALRPTVIPQIAGALTAVGRVRVGERSFGDPTAALVANGVSGLDGWTEWHLGDALGPTLAESLDEVNEEILREYSRAAAAGTAGRATPSHQR